MFNNINEDIIKTESVLQMEIISNVINSNIIKNFHFFFLERGRFQCSLCISSKGRGNIGGGGARLGAEARKIKHLTY